MSDLQSGGVVRRDSPHPRRHIRGLSDLDFGGNKKLRPITMKLRPITKPPRFVDILEVKPCICHRVWDGRAWTNCFF